jgi:hypothetical protein
MELLLNILWLLLALPAIWIWLRRPESNEESRLFGKLRPFLLLGCALVLLFPVISATDDLHAMRSEMEESSPSKRMVKQAASDKSGTSAPHSGGSQALSTSIAELTSDQQVCGHVSATSVPAPEQVLFSACGSRAPPVSSLG